MLTRPSMYFEGPEKKVEIGLTAEGPSLLELDPQFWRDRVKESGAVILSELGGVAQGVKAYLLSESSLFVYARRIVMITCGRTTLVTAAEAMLDAWKDEVEYLVYERKNEHFPELQPTTFTDDAQRLAARLPAEAWRFGSPDGHRIQMLATEAPIETPASERTLEVLMHGIHPEAAKMFGKDRAEADPARTAALRGLFEGFEVDEFFFEPTGYSVNALKDGSYLTIHVTPEDIASYVSFETNLEIGDDPSAWVARVQRVFEPRGLDVMTFSPAPLAPFGLPDHQMVGWTEKKLACGFHVQFRHFERALSGPGEPFPLTLDLA